MNRRVGKAAGLLDDLKQLSKNDIRLGHKRYYDVRTIAQDCKSAGLSIKNMEGVFLKPITTRQMLELGLSDKILKAFCDTGREYPQLCLSILAEAVKAGNVDNSEGI